MNISWSSSDHLNADVVDDASGQVLFHLDTPYKLFKKQITTMTDAQGQVVGEYEPRLGHDRVTYKGETHRVSDWLPTNGFFSTTRRLHTPDGKTYLWKEKSFAKFKLVDAQSEAVVARTHAPNLGIRSARHNIIIDAGPEIVPFLDSCSPSSYAKPSGARDSGRTWPRARCRLLMQLLSWPLDLDSNVCMHIVD